jgi:AraC-like DNA-binding protein
MKRLSQKEIKEIEILIDKGYSLNKISRKLNKNKTTIYYYFRKIKGKTFKPLKINLTEELLGEFIGLFAGDGSFYKTPSYHYRIGLHFNVAEKEFTEDLIKKVLIPLFGKKPMIFTQDSRLNLVYYSKEIYLLIKRYLEWDKNQRKTYSVKLKKEGHSDKFLKGFIRGSLDSDGHYSGKKISFATVSPGLAKNIQESLNHFNFEHSSRLYNDSRGNRKPIYHLTLSRKAHKNFILSIKPRNKIKKG